MSEESVMMEAGKVCTIGTTKSVRAPSEKRREPFATGRALDGRFAPQNALDGKPGGSSRTRTGTGPA